MQVHLFVLFAVATICSSSNAGDIRREDQTSSGKCGEYLTWTFNKAQGYFKVSGDGEMTAPCTFSYPNDVKVIEIEYGVTTIAEEAFKGWAMTSVTIPLSVTHIKPSAFNGCSSLTSVTIPNTVTMIGGSVFYGCRSLKTIELPNNLVYIPSNFCRGCGNLTALTLPPSITSIGDDAFSGCRGLKAILLPESLNTIGDRAFYGCFMTRVYSLVSHPIGNVGAFDPEEETVVCVPPAYTWETFGNKNVAHDYEHCLDFYSMFDHCYEGVIRDDTIIKKKRDNATEWESKTNACGRYQCDDKKGPLWWSTCNSTNETRRVCLNGACVAKTVFVEIEVDPMIKVTEEMTDDLKNTLSVGCGLDKSDIYVGYETDGETMLLVIVYLGDEKEAETVADYVRECMVSSKNHEEL